MKAVAVTGCRNNYPLVDRNGKPLHVGDTIRYQYCSGRYGQTAITQATVTKAHYPYGSIESAIFRLDSSAKVLRGEHVHSDPEHGHETWVEIIKSRATVKEEAPHETSAQN